MDICSRNCRNDGNFLFGMGYGQGKRGIVGCVYGVKTQIFRKKTYGKETSIIGVRKFMSGVRLIWKGKCKMRKNYIDNIRWTTLFDFGNKKGLENIQKKY